MSGAGETTSRKKPAKKVPFWKRDLGKKGDDDAVEHEVFTPTLPAVNLLPPAVHDAVRASKVRTVFVLLGVLLVAASAVVWWLQGGLINSSEQALATAQAENARLTAQTAGFKPVQSMYTQITGLQDVVTAAMASQPQAAVVVERLLAIGAEVPGKIPLDFTSVQADYTGIPSPGGPTTTCPNPNPFSKEITVGCMSFSATASNREQVSELLRLIEADPLFTGPYVTTTALSIAQTTPGASAPAPAQVAFVGSAGIALDALQTTLTEQQIAAIMTPPTPTPSPSPSGGGA